MKKIIYAVWFLGGVQEFSARDAAEAFVDYLAKRGVASEMGPVIEQVAGGVSCAV